MLVPANASRIPLRPCGWEQFEAVSALATFAASFVEVQHAFVLLGILTGLRLVALRVPGVRHHAALVVVGLIDVWLLAFPCPNCKLVPRHQQGLLLVVPKEATEGIDSPREGKRHLGALWGSRALLGHVWRELPIRRPRAAPTANSMTTPSGSTTTPDIVTSPSGSSPPPHETAPLTTATTAPDIVATTTTTTTTTTTLNRLSDRFG